MSKETPELDIPESIFIGTLPEQKAFSLEWYRINEWGDEGVEYRRVGCNENIDKGQEQHD